MWWFLIGKCCHVCGYSIIHSGLSNYFQNKDEYVQSYVKSCTNNGEFIKSKVRKKELE